MPKNQMTGKVAKIYDTVSISTKSGSTFNKREMVLDCSIFDRYTGEKIPNYVLFEFSGKNCDILNNFKKDDRVTVSFVLQGSVFKDEKSGQNRVITHAVGYDCTPYVSQRENTQFDGQQPQQSAQTVAPQGVHQAPQPQPQQQPAPTTQPQGGNYGNGEDALPF